MTGSPKSNASGIRRWSARAVAVKKTALTLCALSALCLPIAGCFEATRSTVTGAGILSSEQRRVAAKEARCARWRMIKFDAESDTITTMQAIRVHNQTGVNAGCWKAPR